MRVVALLALTACYSPDVASCVVACETNLDCPSGQSCGAGVCGVPGTCGVDGPAPDGDPVETLCAGQSGPLGTICVAPGTTLTTLTTSTEIDTDADERCAGATAPGCVLVVDTIPEDVVLRAVGSKPLIVWSPTSLNVIGTIDAASHVGGAKPGAGANPSSCQSSMIEGGTVMPGGGGAGGTFFTLGGIGGDSPNSSGGNPTPTVTGGAFRGGCFGGKGGHSADNRGAGGGAIYLVAFGSVMVSGIVNASGAGATHATTGNGGGGGGGSGGWIAVDASSIVFLDSAVVLAIGGGGSPGSGASVAGTIDGNDPTTTSPFQAEPATTNIGGCLTDSNGGAGSFGVGDGLPGQTSMDGSCGAGGGGGGSGRVTTDPVTPPATGATVSPPVNASPPA